MLFTKNRFYLFRKKLEKDNLIYYFPIQISAPIQKPTITCLSIEIRGLFMTLYPWWNYCCQKLGTFQKKWQVFDRVPNTPIYLFKKNLKRYKWIYYFPIQISTPTQKIMITYLSTKIRDVFMTLCPWWNYCWKS